MPTLVDANGNYVPLQRHPDPNPIDFFIGEVLPAVLP